MWHNPLPLQLVGVTDSYSYLYMPPGVTGIPMGDDHPGAFSFVRRHHVHEGVDLYCKEGTPVHAVEDGEVVAVMPFTGPSAKLDWWLDTECIMVEGKSGVVVYGEVLALTFVGRRVAAGQCIGSVKQVLGKDKGRPRSMLHLELHEHGSRSCPEWYLGFRPEVLCDPTPYLLEVR